MQGTNRLENFPISFYAAVMGLAGLTIAWGKVQHTLGIHLNIDAWLAGVTVALFAIFTALYTTKLVRYRVLFHRAIPDKLMPTLFILIAPPAVGFIAYFKLTGALDSFARILYFVALFFTLLLLTQLGRFAKLRFFLSWWAYSFPLAAVTIASLLMYEQTGASAYLHVGVGLLLALTGIVVLLLVRTLSAVRKHGICVPEQ